MNTPLDALPRPNEDTLLECYREASALEDARPGSGLRAAVLAAARQQAQARDHEPAPDESTGAGVAAAEPPAPPDDSVPASAPIPAQASAEAANDRRWLVPAVASVALFSLAGLLLLQIDRGAPQERDLALGQADNRTVHEAAVTPSTADDADDLEAAGIRAPDAPDHARESNGADMAPPELLPAPAAEPEAEAASKPASTEPGAPSAMPPRATVVGPAAARSEAGAELASATPAEAAPEHTKTQPAPAPRAGRERQAAARPAAPQPPAAARPVPSPSETRPADEAGPSAPAAALPVPPASDMARETPAATDTLTARQRLLAGAALGQREMVAQALRDGAGVDSTDGAGRTAMMLAARRGDVDTVRALVAAGADIRHSDRSGLTAAELARRAGHEALANWLEQLLASGK